MRWSSNNGHPVNPHRPVGHFSRAHLDSDSPASSVGAACLKHRDVLDDVGSCFPAGLVAALVDPLRLHSGEEAFDHHVIPAIAFAAHAALDAMGLEQLAKVFAGVMHARSEWWTNCPFGGRRRHSAICRAAQTKVAVRRRPIDQPTTLPEYRPMTTARYSHPCCVHTRTGDVIGIDMVGGLDSKVPLQAILEHRLAVIAVDAHPISQCPQRLGCLRRDP